jgi:hypothetical protein
LLPPEVGLAAKARGLHRGLSLIVVVAMVVVGAGYGAASLHAADANAQLEAANSRTQDLLAQQKKYSEVRTVNKELELVTAARQVGSSTEINWRTYLRSIQASLPSGTTIATFSAKSATPLAEFTQATAPLQGERIAELTFTAVTDSLPDVPAWLNALAKLKGFVDASPGSVTLSGNTYTASIVMHVNEQALANRFADEAAKPTTTKDDAESGSSGITTDASKDGGK